MLLLSHLMAKELVELSVGKVVEAWRLLERHRDLGRGRTIGQKEASRASNRERLAYPPV